MCKTSSRCKQILIKHQITFRPWVPKLSIQKKEIGATTQSICTTKQIEAKANQTIKLSF